MKNDYQRFDGVTYRVWTTVNRRIALTGLGFLGPYLADGSFRVSIIIETVPDWKTILETGKFEVYAKKREIFYVDFDKPFTMEANKCYSMGYKLDGPKTGVLDELQAIIKVDDVSFCFSTDSRQLAELKYILLDKY
ncbi:uncharacterized protein LOC110860868 [Folsomia candida]|uniref:uncharacterized protein LOC110860868 n=1 Tax=Folsomia candida TaxID=158441 RepID=UPI001604AA09|nr:uncharacterized protein LOC110860868 [Folsomia candida]